MIQFNLLPDVKTEYIKTRRTKRLAMLAALITVGASVSICFLLFLITQWNNKTSEDLSKHMKQIETEIQSIQDLDKKLTIQNQLSQLTKLHEEKPITSRVDQYMLTITPKENTVEKYKFDLLTNHMALSGKTSSAALVNKFADNIKLTAFCRNTPQECEAARVDSKKYGALSRPFSKVVADIKKDEKGEVTFTIDADFDPAIFAYAKPEETVRLVVPSTVSSRSNLENPGSVFSSPESSSAPAPTTTTNTTGAR